MIITHGDLLNTDIKIIAHQVNCKGVMGGGLAKQIRDRYPNVFKEYATFIQDYKECNYGESPLGTVCYYRVDENRCIWNVFGQEDYGTDKCYTDYDAVKKAFTNEIENWRCSEHCNWENQIPIAIPCYFGCGLGGGDWSIMKSVLEEIEKDQNVIFVAYKYS
jgi:O-acetyl-ADP-ribose deacetylase (regulator of RNase III)